MAYPFRVRYGDAEHLVVDIGPGTSEQGIEKAIAGCVGLPVGTFVLKNAAGVTSTFHAGLVGDWDVVLLNAQPGAGAGGEAGALAGVSNLATPGAFAPTRPHGAFRLALSPVSHRRHFREPLCQVAHFPPQRFRGSGCKHDVPAVRARCISVVFAGCLP